MDLVAQDEHERLMEALPNDAAEWLTVQIDACLAPGIVVAKLRGCRPTKGVTKYSYALHVEPSRELAGRVRAVQPLQLIECERDVGGPRRQQFAHTARLLRLPQPHTELYVILRRPSHYPAVGENDDTRARSEERRVGKECRSRWSPH